MNCRSVGYARVSTGEQTVDAQKEALRAAGCVQIFCDVASGAKNDRTGLGAAMAALQAGDTLVVARLDRLGRSMLHLVATVHELAARGIGFHSLAESIDTTSAAGRLVLHIFASLADFERELIRERTREALAAKKRRGEHIGRRPAFNSARITAAREMLAGGLGAAHVARVLKVGRSTLYRALSAQVMPPTKRRGRTPVAPLCDAPRPVRPPTGSGRAEHSGCIPNRSEA